MMNKSRLVDAGIWRRAFFASAAAGAGAGAGSG